MSPESPPLIAFAHRGAPGPRVRENTLPAFVAAVRAGLTAVESDVWLTADRVPVLVHDGVRRIGLRRRRIRDLPAAALPRWLPRLADLYAAVGADVEVSLDLKDPAAAEPVLEVAAAAGGLRRLWLCAALAPLVRCRGLSSQVRLANSTTLRGTPADAHVRRLAQAGIDALNLRCPEWTAARVEIVHRHGVRAFAWDVQARAAMARVVAFGCDAIYSDHVELLRSAATAAGPHRTARR